MLNKFLTRNPSTEILRLAATQPFVDQAATHTFSDWLLVCCYDFGYDPDEDVDLGALPDIGRPKIDFKSISKRELLPLGELLRSKSNGRHFFDLGCGDPRISVVPRLLAENFRVKHYFGVDLFHADDTATYTKMDILEFLARLDISEPKAFFFGGVDPVDEDCFEYLRAVRSELVRLCNKGDNIILGAGSTGFGFEELPKQFNSIYTDAFHEIIEAR